MSDDSFIYNEELLPTKELLKRKRKKAYEAQKAKAKERRKQEKQVKIDAKKARQSERDKELVEMIHLAKDLES